MAQNKMVSNKPSGKPFTLAIIAPIRPGASEAWRRYLQELLGSRRDEYETACRRWGITRERVWIIETLKGPLTILAIDADEPKLVLEQWVKGELPFERQFREQLLLVQGFDLTGLQSSTSPIWGDEGASDRRCSPPVAPIELVLDWLGPTEPYARGGGDEE